MWHFLWVKSFVAKFRRPCKLVQGKPAKLTFTDERSIETVRKMTQREIKSKQKWCAAPTPRNTYCIRQRGAHYYQCNVMKENNYRINQCKIAAKRNVPLHASMSFTYPNAEGTHAPNYARQAVRNLNYSRSEVDRRLSTCLSTSQAQLQENYPTRHPSVRAPNRQMCCQYREALAVFQ